MPTKRQTAHNQHPAQEGTGAEGRAPFGLNVILQNEPENRTVTPLDSTKLAQKISTEPSINIPHHINNTDTTLNYYKFAKFKIVRHTTLTAQASARGPRP